MGLPQSPTPSHLYPQELQLKLYQAFIFSIPILFSIILFLLFYLFYLKRRTPWLSSPPRIIQRSSSQATRYHVSSIYQKEEITDKLPTVLFDEELRTKDSQCCVCLGEFEIKEELLQIPSCKHMFHIECIRHWLHSNSTCPLCRCYVIFPATIFCTNPPQSSGPVLLLQSSVGANSHQPQNITSELQQQQDVGAGSTEQLVIPMEESSSVTSQLRDSSRLPELSISMENGRGSPNGESVILHIQRHST